jgi:hypothetical protein
VKLDKSSVGKVNYNFVNASNRNLVDHIQTINPLQMFIGQAPYALLSLPNELFLIVFNNKLELYNSDLELIDYTHEVYHGQLLNCCAATSDNCDKIYLCSYRSHSISVIDLKLRPYRKLPIQDTQVVLNHPNDIFFYKNHVYVVDLDSRVVRLSAYNLEFEVEYKIDFSARQLKIVNDIVCVNTVDFDLIVFYDIIDFHVLRKYDRRHGPICELNGAIYEFDRNGDKIFCYNSDGSLDVELKTRFDRVSFDNTIGIAYHGSKVIISSSCGKLICL